MHRTEIGRIAAEETRERFRSELSRHTTLTEEEIGRLFPSRQDQEELQRLIRIVDEATDENTKRDNLILNIRDVAGAIVKVLPKAIGLPL